MVWLSMKVATVENGNVRLQKGNKLGDLTGHFLIFLFYPFRSRSLISTPRTLQHYLLEVQDYLENSCDPELESPAKHNTTD